MVKNGNFTFLLLVLILADEVADLHPPVLSLSGQEWQFHISTVRAHIGRSTCRSTPRYLPRRGVLRERPFTREGNYLVSLLQCLGMSPHHLLRLNSPLYFIINHKTLLIPLYTNIIDSILFYFLRFVYLSYFLWDHLSPTRNKDLLKYLLLYTTNFWNYCNFHTLHIRIKNYSTFSICVVWLHARF